jgi:alpha-beta hydrolase superfamily lysophospholipase
MLILPFHRRVARPIAFTIGALFLLGIGAGLAFAQTPTATAPTPSTAASFTVLYIAGFDTVGVERMVHNETSLSGDLRMRGQPRMKWTEQLREPAGVYTVHIDAWRPGASDSDAPMQRLVLQTRGDSAYVFAAPAQGATLGAPMATLPARAGSRWMINQSLAHAGWIAQQTAGDTAWIILATGARLVPAVVKRTDANMSFTLAGLTSEFEFNTNGSPARFRVPSQGLRAEIVWGDAPLSVSAANAAPISYAAPPSAPYTASDVRIATPAGHTLAGTLTMPRGASARVPVTVTISGSGAQERDGAIPGIEGYRVFRQLADTLGARGVAVLRLDDRGVGASTGNHAAATSRDFADDVRAAVTWLRSRDDIDGDRIALIGHSEGGIIAPMVAANDARLAGIVVLAGPAYSGSRIVAFQQQDAIAQMMPGATSAARDSAFRSAQAQLENVAQASAWMREFLSYDPLPTARKVKQPVLILHGERDQQVTVEQADTLAAAMRTGGNANVTVHRLRNTNHLFQRDSSGVPGGYGTLTDRKVTTEMMGLLSDWLVRTLRVTAR